MPEKKELNGEQLEKVSGGLQSSTKEGVEFKYSLGQEFVLNDAGNVSVKIVKRGIGSMITGWSLYEACYYLEVTYTEFNFNEYPIGMKFWEIEPLLDERKIEDASTYNNMTIEEYDSLQ